jgi:hypothetical protein
MRTRAPVTAPPGTDRSCYFLPWPSRSRDKAAENSIGAKEKSERIAKAAGGRHLGTFADAAGFQREAGVGIAACGAGQGTDVLNIDQPAEIARLADQLIQRALPHFTITPSACCRFAELADKKARRKR